MNWSQVHSAERRVAKDAPGIVVIACAAMWVGAIVYTVAGWVQP